MKNLMFMPAAFLVMLLAGCNSSDSSSSRSAPASADGPVAVTTAYPGGVWEPPEPSWGVVTRADVVIPMRDGVELVADIYVPANLNDGEVAAGSFPVMLQQSPYNTSRESGSALETADYFVERGYIFVDVDVRGSGRSGGSGSFMGPPDQLDGIDLVNWTARDLNGSDGRIVMFGCSYRGHSAMYTSAILGANSPVKAMIASCAGGDPYREIHMLQGIPSVSWRFAGLFSPAVFGPTFIPYMATNYADSQTHDQYGQAGDNAYYRDFWAHRDHIADAVGIAEAGIPVLIQAGWDDSGSGGVDVYNSLQNAWHGRDPFATLMHGEPVSDRYQLIVGNWGHGEGLDDGIMFQWLERWLEDVDTGIDTSTPMHMQVIEPGNSGRWINAAGYPLTSVYTRYFLHGDGELSTLAPAVPAIETLVWASPEADGAVLDYTTPPFDDGALIGGPVAVTLYASSSNTNLMFVTKLYDLAPDGTETEISRSAVMGSMLATDTGSKSWVDDNGLAIRPYLLLERDEYLIPGQIYKISLPFLHRIFGVQPGHAIRLSIRSQEAATDCSLSVQVYFRSVPRACDPRPGLLATLLGGQYALQLGGVTPSTLQLPLIPYNAFPGVRTGKTPTSGDFTLPLDWGQ